MHKGKQCAHASLKCQVLRTYTSAVRHREGLRVLKTLIFFSWALLGSWEWKPCPASEHHSGFPGWICMLPVTCGQPIQVGSCGGGALNTKASLEAQEIWGEWGDLAGEKLEAWRKAQRSSWFCGRNISVRVGRLIHNPANHQMLHDLGKSCLKIWSNYLSIY